MAPLGKNRPIRAVDNVPAVSGGALPSTGAILSEAPPAAAQPTAPTGLSLSTGLSQADRSATAYIIATWSQPFDGDPTGYIVQIATDSNFTQNVSSFAVQRPDPDQAPSALIRGLTPYTQYYVRVAARFYEAVSGWSSPATITTLQDTTPPDPVTGAAASWSADGEARITWSNPGNANFWRVRITIRKDTSAGALVLTDYSISGSFVLSREQNRVLAGLYPTLWIELVTQNYGGFFQSVGVVTLTTTKAKPGNPTSVAQSWSGDTGTASADLTVTCAAITDAVRYRWTIDGTAYETIEPRFVYSLAMNRQQHSGTPASSVSYSIVGVDGLGQISATAASGTATNAAPAAPTASILGGGYLIAVNVDASYVEPADFLHYLIRIEKDGVWLTPSTTAKQRNNVFETKGSGTFRVGVKAVDVFGQASTEYTSSTVVLDLPTIEDLRAETSYSNEIGTSATTLAAYKDADVATPVLTYSGSTERWEQAQRPQLDYVRMIRIAVANSGVGAYYLATSTNGTTWRWWSGATASWSEQSSQANAQTNSLFLASGYNNLLISLPSRIECRFVRLYHRGGTSRQIYEFYPRRLVEADDIRVENLAAISSNFGTITAGNVTGVTFTGNSFTGETITGSTITGSTVRTAASGARVEMSGSILKTTDSGGASNFVLNGQGAGDVAIITAGSYDSSRGYSFRATDNSLVGGMYAFSTAGDARIRIENTQVGGKIGIGEVAGALGGKAILLSEMLTVIQDGAEVYGQLAIGMGRESNVALSIDGSDYGTAILVRNGLSSSGMKFLVYGDGNVTSAATIQAKQFKTAGNSELGSTAGSFIDLASFEALASNNVQLKVRLARSATGTDWTTAPLQLRRVTDSTGQAFIALIDSNIGFNTNDQFGGGNGIIGIANRITAPTTTPTGGGYVWVSSGELWYRGSNGTATRLAVA